MNDTEKKNNMTYPDCYGKYLKIVYDAFEKKGTLDSEEMSNEDKLDVFHFSSIFE